MSEILRAILDKNCLDSSLAFYTGQVAILTTVTGTKTFVRREISIQCKSDCYFLAIGGAQFVYLNGGGVHGVGGKGEATAWAIKRASNLELNQIAPQIKPNLNYNLNNFVTWPEYMLFEPAETITFVQDVQATDFAIAVTRTTLCVLQGVEYRMPPNQRIPANA